LREIDFQLKNLLIDSLIISLMERIYAVLNNQSRKKWTFCSSKIVEGPRLTNCQ